MLRPTTLEATPSATTYTRTWPVPAKLLGIEMLIWSRPGYAATGPAYRTGTLWPATKHWTEAAPRMPVPYSSTYSVSVEPPRLSGKGRQLRTAGGLQVNTGWFASW